MSKDAKGGEESAIPKVRFYRRPYPEVGELVVGTVTRIEDHGAYVVLNEYANAEAYVPINEILQSWFRSIKDYLRVGSRAVFKVIKVDPSRGLIDLSLKRVRPEERDRKFLEWKRNVKAVKLLEIIAKKLNMSLDRLMEEVGWKMGEYYGDMYRAFEEAAKGNVDGLVRLGVRKEIIDEIVNIAKERVEMPKVTIVGLIRIVNIRPDGVEHIRRILSEAEAKVKGMGIEARIYAIGPPRYRLELTGTNPKALEEAFNELSRFIASEAKASGGEASVSRVQEGG